MFGSFFNTQTVQPKTVVAKKQSQKELVEEIHETFFTEVDFLLKYAENQNVLSTDKKAIIEKGDRLQNLGFKKAKDTIVSINEKGRIRELERENEKKAQLVKAIQYFSFKYPNYKFITEESVIKICEKYGLIYADVDLYTGDVPDKNLKHIEDFKIKDEDKCYLVTQTYTGGFSRQDETYFASHEKCLEIEKEKREKNDSHRYTPAGLVHIRKSCSEAKFMIAAPVKDFDLSDRRHTVKDSQIVTIVEDDPIVLSPVMFGGKKHFLIVTAWGLEASDEDVVNQRMN